MMQRNLNDKKKTFSQFRHLNKNLIIMAKFIKIDCLKVFERGPLSPKVKALGKQNSLLQCRCSTLGLMCSSRVVEIRHTVTDGISSSDCKYCAH